MSVGRTVKNIALALLPLVILLVLVELALWAVGLGGDGGLSLSRGFDRSARYLVPDGQGGWRTQMFEVDYLEVDVPDKGERRRVILLGGSNTQGFPERVLEALLNAADPAPGWEVVNLGRAGYGSERVSILAEQALALDPDVMVIYTGHNEFMERGFALELRGRGALSAVNRVADALGGLRSLNLLREAFQPDLTDRSVDKKPEPREQRDESFKRLQYDETERAFAAYRKNLELICALGAEHDVGLVLCTVLGNDFVPPFVTNYARDLSQAEVDEHRRLTGLARRLIPERYRAHLLPPVYLSQPDWGIGLRPEELAAREQNPPAPGRVVPPLRQQTGPLGEVPATSGRKSTSIEGAHWPDPRVWVSAVYDVLDTISAVYARELNDEERADLIRAQRHFAAARALADDAPQAAFEQGLVAFLLGDEDAALANFRRAAVLDRAPRRGNDVTNGAVRVIAAEHDVELLDIEQLFRDRSPHGLVGYEIMTDVCHMQPGVRPVLMADLVPGILAAQSKRSNRAALMGTRTR
jgi:hypothetical protein